MDDDADDDKNIYYQHQKWANPTSMRKDDVGDYGCVGCYRKRKRRQRRAKTTSKALQRTRGFLTAFASLIVSIGDRQLWRRKLKGILVVNEDLLLPSLALFGLLLLSLLCLSALHVFRSFTRFSSLTLVFLLALLALYSLFATCLAIAEEARRRLKKKGDDDDVQARPYRLRPLLFITTVLTVVGLPLLWLLPFLCRHFVLHPFVSIHLCPAFSSSSSIFPSVVLSLLLTAVVPLRPLLHHGLVRLRQDVFRKRLFRSSSSSLGKKKNANFTLFNLFCQQMDTTAMPMEQRALFEEWRRDMEMEQFGEQYTEPLEEAEGIISNNNRTQRTRSILVKADEPSRRQRRRTSVEHVQFSELLLIRQVENTGHEDDQLAQLEEHQQLVLEQSCVNFVRDFRVKMNRKGRIAPRSARQIVCRFAPPARQQHSKTAASGRRGRRGRRTTEERDYASIDEDDGDVGAKLAAASRARTITMSASFDQCRRPRLPTTPVPRSTPASLLASPSTPIQDSLLPLATTLVAMQPLLGQTVADASTTTATTEIVYENMPSQQHGTLTPLMEEEKGKFNNPERPTKLPLPTPRRMVARNTKATNGKMSRTSPRECWCPLGTQCHAMGSRASVHYYVLSSEGVAKCEEEEERDGDETEEDGGEAEEEQEE